MNKPAMFVGIDVGAETFTASIGKFEEEVGWQITAKSKCFENNYDAFSQFIY